MAKLYELRNEYEEAIANIENYINEEGEISTEYTELLNGIEDNIKDKAESVAEFIKRLLADKEQYKAEIKRLQALEKKTDKQIEFYKQYLTSALQTANIDKVEGVKATISFIQSERVEIGEEAVIPKKYQVATFKPDKTAIKTAILQGKKFKGVEIVKVSNIQIK